ncbi:unnamed protein product [Amoebophrya sp. A25]|nr:unnamed protein product [Amoebophrya sp. A25]|eukprot:GSA25T00001410001.1
MNNSGGGGAARPVTEPATITSTTSTFMINGSTSSSARTSSRFPTSRLRKVLNTISRTIRINLLYAYALGVALLCAGVVFLEPATAHQDKDVINALFSKKTVTERLAFDDAAILENENELFGGSSVVFTNAAGSAAAEGNPNLFVYSVDFKILVFLILQKAILFPIAASLPLPAGVFTPVFVLGAAVGRLFGEFLDLPEPALYAVVGATCVTCGVTRMISVIVIVSELTGQINHLLPLLLAACVSFCSSALLSEPIFDVIIHLKEMQFLPHLQNPAAYARLCAGDLCRGLVVTEDEECVKGTEDEECVEQGEHQDCPSSSRSDDKISNLFLYESFTRSELIACLRLARAHGYCHSSWYCEEKKIAKRKGTSTTTSQGQQNARLDQEEPILSEQERTAGIEVEDSYRAGLRSSLLAPGNYSDDESTSGAGHLLVVYNTSSRPRGTHVEDLQEDEDHFSPSRRNMDNYREEQQDAKHKDKHSALHAVSSTPSVPQLQDAYSEQCNAEEEHLLTEHFAAHCLPIAVVQRPSTAGTSSKKILRHVFHPNENLLDDAPLTVPAKMSLARIHFLFLMLGLDTVFVLDQEQDYRQEACTTSRADGRAEVIGIITRDSFFQALNTMSCCV